MGYLKDNHKELFHIYQALVDAHKHVPNDLDLLSLQAYFYHKYPDADKGMYDALFESFQKQNIDPALAQQMLKEMKAQKLSLGLSEAAFKFSTGNGKLEDIAEAYRHLEEVPNQEEFKFVTTNLDTLLNESVLKTGRRWRLNFLNKSLGSLRKGDFGFIFARPETGKTTFLASEVSAMLRNLGHEDGPIIWFNNEEQGSKVMLRLYQAYFGCTLEQLLANRKKFDVEFNAQTQGKFLLVDDANISKSLVEKLLKQHEPSLVVYDQITKIKGFAADREDLKLGAICIWARELAKQYAPSIGVFQAGGSAGDQKWLTMEHVANVTTAAQAEADWILGIGTVNAEGAQFIRYLNISKNKLAGDSDTLAHLRHGRSEVLIEPHIARYKDIVKYE
jgi:replicative DNA helicase